MANVVAAAADAAATEAGGAPGGADAEAAADGAVADEPDVWSTPDIAERREKRVGKHFWMGGLTVQKTGSATIKRWIVLFHFNLEPTRVR